MDLRALLKRVQLFGGLSDDELAKLEALCTMQKAAAGESIIQQNTMGSSMYIIGDGAVEVFIQGLTDERSLVVLGKGQVMGEMAIIDQGYRSASVRATKEGAVLYVIESKAFYQLCLENHHIGFIVMRNMAIDMAFKLRHRNLAEL